MIKIESANVTVMVSNLDTAINFYTEVLGMTLKNRFSEHWADIEGPGISIGLHPTNKKISIGENIQIGLKVPDLERATSELKSRGIRFKGNDEDQVQLASFCDPDNNTLYLVQL